MDEMAQIKTISNFPPYQRKFKLRNRPIIQFPNRGGN